MTSRMWLVAVIVAVGLALTLAAIIPVPDICKSLSPDSIFYELLGCGPSSGGGGGGAG
jgi:hypothetical protein